LNPGVDEHAAMGGGTVEAQQGRLRFRFDYRVCDVFPGKGANGCGGFPECMRGQFDGAVQFAGEKVPAGESRQFPQFGQERAGEIVVVSGCPSAGGGGMPGPDDGVRAGGHTGTSSFAAQRCGDLDIVLTEYDAGCAPALEPGLGLRQLTFDPYLLIVPQDWTITVRSLSDLNGRPWVAGPPGTACDHALQRVAAQSGITIAGSDVCVEFPSVIALVAADRGAAIIPRLALADAPVTACSLPELGGRHIAALHQTATGYPTPATATVLTTLAEAGQQLTHPT
jgi:LysR substrate binding domain